MLPSVWAAGRPYVVCRISYFAFRMCVVCLILILTGSADVANQRTNDRRRAATSGRCWHVDIQARPRPVIGVSLIDVNWPGRWTGWLRGALARWRVVPAMLGPPRATATCIISHLRSQHVIPLGFERGYLWSTFGSVPPAGSVEPCQAF